MTQHIKCVVLICLLLSLSCSGNSILERSSQEKSDIVKVTADFENYVFYQSFQFCDNPYAALTLEEANNLYKDKTIRLDNNKEKESLNWDSFFYEGAKQCFEEVLGEKHTSSYLFSTEEEFPFSKVAVFNDTYLFVAQDGFFFVFSKTEKKPAQNDSGIREDNRQSASTNNLDALFESLEKQEEIRLPIEYSYDFMLELDGFVSVEEKQNFKKFEHLSDLQFAKLGSKNGSDLLLVAGVMESGQLELYLIAANRNANNVQNLLLYTSREIEDGNILTRFKINKKHQITVTKEEKRKDATSLIEEQLMKIGPNGDFIEVK